MPQSHRFHRYGIAPLLVSLAMLFAPLAQAQIRFVPPYPTLLPPPAAPYNVTPEAIATGSTGNRTPLIVSWSQHSLGNFFLPFWQKSNHFLVCFREDVYVAARPPCRVAEANWSISRNAPPAGYSRVGSRATFDSGHFIDSREIDRSMLISVSACRSLVDADCSVVHSHPYFSTINAISVGTGDGPNNNASTWEIVVRARNGGTGPLPAFTGRVAVYPALGVGSPGRTCRIDIDAADVRNDPNVC